MFDLSLQFLANDFRLPGESCNGAYPLKVLFCERCTLAQLSVVVDPATLYGNYLYVTSKSKTMMDHFHALWSEIKEESPSACYVAEIGSNDGEFLLHAQSRGAKFIVGIEPAENLAEISRMRGVPTHNEMFGESEGFMIGPDDKRPHVIVARHVFAHVSNWHCFISNLTDISSENTLVVIEAPYALDTLQRCEFDQVYHEHLSFLSLHAMAALLKDSPFQMHKVLRFPIHGGAIAIFLRRRDSGIAPHDSVQEMLTQERITIDDWEDFECKACSKIKELIYEVYESKREGKRVAAFGASAKSTVWINACGFTSNDIAFICDNTPQKQGRLSPGSDIPVVPESHLTRENADVVINFAWNFHLEVKEKLKWWIDEDHQLLNPHEL